MNQAQRFRDSWSLGSVDVRGLGSKLALDPHIQGFSPLSLGQNDALGLPHHQNHQLSWIREWTVHLDIVAFLGFVVKVTAELVTLTVNG